MFSVNNSVQCKQLYTWWEQNKEKCKPQWLLAEFQCQRFLLHWHEHIPTFRIRKKEKPNKYQDR